MSTPNVANSYPTPTSGDEAFYQLLNAIHDLVPGEEWIDNIRIWRYAPDAAKGYGGKIAWSMSIGRQLGTHQNANPRAVSEVRRGWYMVALDALRTYEAEEEKRENALGPTYTRVDP